MILATFPGLQEYFWDNSLAIGPVTTMATVLLAVNKLTMEVN